jgi:predicted transposase/invertase (TIGR01784 family)
VWYAIHLDHINHTFYQPFRVKHSIDPKVDCVFKAILGDEDHTNLLIHFLNAILADELKSPVIWVEILNPYNEKETRQDKLSVVDVKARDKEGNLFQVEIQMSVYPSLPDRMGYVWATLVNKQLKKGKDYADLKPTYSIWIVNGNLDKDEPYLNSYRLCNAQGKELGNLGSVWVCELPKFHPKQIKTEKDRWMKLFKEGEKLDDIELPDWMNTPEMRQTMDIIKQFSEQEQRYEHYRARRDYLLEQSTIQSNLQTLQHNLEAETRSKLQALKDVKKERKKKEAERKAKEIALQEKEAALKKEQAALQGKEEALQREADALAELAKLRAELDQARKK